MNEVKLNNPLVVEYLQQNYLVKSNPVMADELGVSVGTVTGLLQRLKLRRPKRDNRVVDLPGETWRECPGYPGYRVSDMGRIAYGDVLLTQTVNGRGYMQVKMWNRSGERRSERVHRFVAICFLDNPEGKPEVNHKNGRKSDNWKDNLEWSTGRENVQHAVQNGLVQRRKGASHHMAKHPEATIRQACQMLADGSSTSEVAEATGLKRAYVYSILTKKVWRSVSDEYFSRSTFNDHPERE